MSVGRGALLALALAALGRAALADPPKGAPPKPALPGKNVTQTQRAAPAASLLPRGPVASSSAAARAQGRKASDLKVIFPTSDLPDSLEFGSIGPGARIDKQAQLNGGVDIIVYLRRDYAGVSSAEMRVYAPGGEAVCYGTANRVSPKPSCRIPSPRPGVYLFSVTNTSQDPGEFSLSFSLPLLIETKAAAPAEPLAAQRKR